MKHWLEDNWPEMVSSFAAGLRIGIFAAILVLILFTLADLAQTSQAALSIVRDLRGEFRSAVGTTGTKEGTEE